MSGFRLVIKTAFRGKCECTAHSDLPIGDDAGNINLRTGVSGTHWSVIEQREIRAQEIRWLCHRWLVPQREFAFAFISWRYFRWVGKMTTLLR